MDSFQSPEFWLALGTAVAGVVIFGLTPLMPSVFPHWFTRLAGFAITGLAAITVWLLTESWLAPALVGGGAVAAMLVIAAVQSASPSRNTAMDSAVAPTPEHPVIPDTDPVSIAMAEPVEPETAAPASPDYSSN